MDIILRKIVLAAVLLFGTSGLVFAAPVTFKFTASDFVATEGSFPAPIDPVIGSFTLDGSGLTAIDLMLGSHTYTTSEVGFNFNYDGNYSFVLGGKLNGLDVVDLGTDDFILSGKLISGAAPIFNLFAYSVSPVLDAWYTYTGSILKLSAPEPASLTLLGIGLVCLGVSRKRKHKTRVE